MILIGVGASLVALLPALAESPLVTRHTAAESPLASEQTGPIAVEAPAVSVKHELVTAAVVPIRSLQRPAVYRPLPAARPHTRTHSFASRARQLFLGDGRFRPEPFPRAGQ